MLSDNHYKEKKNELDHCSTLLANNRTISSLEYK